MGLRRSYLRASLVVLAILVASCVGIEIVTRVFLVKVSRIERRWFEEYRAAVEPKSRVATEKRLLVVGNSLLGEGVKFETFASRLAPAWRADRFLVDDTDYFDWYYGLRRLLREGARYEAIVLVLTAQQFTAQRVRGSYSARRLMRPQDVFRVSYDLGLHPTVASELQLASVSEFYGTRVELRKVLIGRLLPGLPALTSRFVTYPVWRPDLEQLYGTSVHRLQTISQEVGRFGGRFFLVIPPLSRGSKTDGAEAVLRAGATTGVTVLMPLSSDILSNAYYSDGFHLNSEGASIFTESLATSLVDALTCLAGDSGACN